MVNQVAKIAKVEFRTTLKKFDIFQLVVSILPERNPIVLMLYGEGRDLGYALNPIKKT
jgi:hypothetical protein